MSAALPKTSGNDESKNSCISNIINNNNNNNNNNSNNNSDNVAAINQCFPSAFYHRVATFYEQENVIVSPLLIEAMLALLFLGSDGQTAEELNARLHLKRFGNNSKMARYYADVLDAFTNRSQAETTIHMLHHLLFANDVIVTEEFKRIAHKYFHATTETITGNTNTTNLEQHLNSLLRNSSPFNKNPDCNIDVASGESSAEKRAMFLSAVNFQSKWFLPFSAYRSGMYDFCTPLGDATLSATPSQSAKSVPMMFDDDMFVKFGEFRELDARAIELPYEHEEELAMLVILPNDRDGLPELERRLSKIDLYDLAERMQMESVQVLLPKFRLEFQTSLKETLKQIGILEIFNKTANFNNLLKCNDKRKNHLELPISDIFHVVSLEVNESGSDIPTKATPNKPIIISNSIDTRKKFFRADHPFSFVIRSRDIILFAGHVTKC